jgi:hypothetical protein
VLSRDLDVHDIDARHFVNLRRLLEPDYDAYQAAGERRLPLCLILDRGRLVKAVRAGRGRVPLAEVRWHGPAALDRARAENGCSFLVAVELDAARAALREAEERVRLDEDLVAQGLRLARAVQVHVDRGIYLSPRVLKGVPIPSFDAVQRTFDLLFPDDRAAVFYLFERGEIHTSVIAVKRHGDLTELTTHQALGVTLGDWRRDLPRVLQAVERRHAKPHLGFFAELAAWQRITSGAGTMSREVAGRSIVLDPAPPWLLGLVAADAGTQVAKMGVGLLSRFVPKTVMNAAKDLAQTAVERGPFALLGFNPFDVAGQLLRLRRPPRE